MPKITAVIIAYWPSRHPSIPLIVQELRSGSRVPDHIIVVNNNPRVPLAPIEGCSLLNAQHNYTSRAKYAAAMLEPSDYYMLLDDDIGADRDFIAHYESIAYPGCCLCDGGFILVDNFSTHGRFVGAWDVQQNTRIDIFIGRMQFLSFQAIVNMFSIEAKIRIPNLPRYRSVGEDLLIALANESYVVAIDPNRQYKGTPKPSFVGRMARDPGHLALRDEFCHRARLALGMSPFPGPVPGESKDDQIRTAIYLQLLKDRDEGKIPCEMEISELNKYEKDHWAIFSSPAPTGS